ncbi:MAG: VOC family protein [archaeon]|nr:MAG: VOC family protein [archaeon]
MPDIRIGSVVFDCNDFDRMHSFWQEALHYDPKRPPAYGWVILRDPEGKSPNVSFNLLDKPVSGRIRVHLDLYADDQKAEVERLLKLGATLVKDPGEGHDYVILSDPEGNHFCIVQK